MRRQHGAAEDEEQWCYVPDTVLGLNDIWKLPADLKTAFELFCCRGYPGRSGRADIEATCGFDSMSLDVFIFWSAMCHIMAYWAEKGKTIVIRCG